MEAHIQYLILEVTRRCNMTCEHCLRGEPQKLDMSDEIVAAALDQVGSIGTLTFSGGEPSLNAKAIRRAVDIIKSRGISVENFYVVTNGKQYSPEMVLALMDLEGHIRETNDGRDPELDSVLVISRDTYHDNVPPSNLYRYQALAFYDIDDEEHREDIPSLLNEGRAAANGIGDRDVFPSFLEVEVTDDEVIVHDGEVYINAKGDVVPNCDYSYKHQEEERLGNVLKESLTDILSRQAKPLHTAA